MQQEFIEKTEEKTAAETRLHGRLLRVVQAVWIFVAIVALLLVIVSLPPFFTQSQSLCIGSACNGVLVSPAQAQALAAHGISLASYAWYSVVVTLLSTLVWFSAGWVIFRYKSDSWIALLVGLQAVTQGASTSIAALGSVPIFQYPATWLLSLNQVLLVVVFALFPTGHFVPKWLRWLVLAWVAYNLVDVLFHGVLQQMGWYSALSFLLFAGVMAIIIVAQIYRYRSASTPAQRQQTKWVVFAVATIILAQLVLVVPGLFNPILLRPDSLYSLLGGNLMIFVLLLGPVALAIAIMRYRLYDIDVIINRTLVYGSLTALLALIYVGLTIGLESLIGLLTGQTSQPVIIVISTLAIAALFGPLRHRIQQIIDRRFYRKKYDAEKTLAAFSATLRNEVNLDQLIEQLLAVVKETMQPTHVSLWLRPVEQRSESRSQAFIQAGKDNTHAQLEEA